MTSCSGPLSARQARDAPLQGAPHSRGDLGMAPADLLEDGHRADAGCGLQHRHDLAVPDPGKRVGTAAATRRLLLGRQPRIGFDPIGGGGAEPGLRGGDGGDVALTGLHVQPHLAVGDVAAGQVLILLRDEESDAAPSRSDRQTTSVPWGKRAAGGSLTPVGLRPPSVSQPPAHSHPDCRSPLTLIVARQASSRCRCSRGWPRFSMAKLHAISPQSAEWALDGARSIWLLAASWIVLHRALAAWTSAEWIDSFLVALSLASGLLLLAKHLFVRRHGGDCPCRRMCDEPS